MQFRASSSATSPSIELSLEHGDTAHVISRLLSPHDLSSYFDQSTHFDNDGQSTANRSCTTERPEREDRERGHSKLVIFFEALNEVSDNDKT
jgi:hypothetical protein